MDVSVVEMKRGSFSFFSEYKWKAGGLGIRLPGANYFTGRALNAEYNFFAGTVKITLWSVY